MAVSALALVTRRATEAQAFLKAGERFSWKALAPSTKSSDAKATA